MINILGLPLAYSLLITFRATDCCGARANQTDNPMDCTGLGRPSEEASVGKSFYFVPYMDPPPIQAKNLFFLTSFGLRLLPYIRLLLESFPRAMMEFALSFLINVSALIEPLEQIGFKRDGLTSFVIKFNFFTRNL